MSMSISKSLLSAAVALAAFPAFAENNNEAGMILETSLNPFPNNRDGERNFPEKSLEDGYLHQSCVKFELGGRNGGFGPSSRRSIFLTGACDEGFVKADQSYDVYDHKTESTKTITKDVNVCPSGTIKVITSVPLTSCYAPVIL